MQFSKIKVTGSYAPEKIVTNDDLEKIVDTNDEWIFSRTGIKQRHVSMGENNSDLATVTARQIIEKGKIDPLDIDLIIVGTATGDYITPSVSCIVQKNIGATNAIAFDINAACSGFVFGLSVADKYIKSGIVRNALVIGVEIVSKFIDWTDRNTCVLFGDGCGGAFLEASDKPGIISEDIGSDGSKGLFLRGGGKSPVNAFNDVKPSDEPYLIMDGKVIFNFATKQVPKSIQKLIEENNINIDEIKYIVPHQANARIVETISKKLHIPMEKFYLNISEYANTSAASIPLALNEMFDKNLLKEGDKIIISGFGGGLTWGSMYIEI